jgi:SGNH domain (fused to AT3 domains)
VILTQEYGNGPDGKNYTGAQWQQGLAKTISLIHVPKDRIVVLGNIPVLPTAGPECLSRNPDNVQACSGPSSSLFAPVNSAEQMAATAVGAHYVNITPWFCSNTWTAVIDKYEVYFDRYHVTAAYAMFLAGVLARSLNLALPGNFSKL